MSRGWHAAFVAVTVALGDSVDDALGSLGATEASLPPDGAALVKALRSESRDTRVRALAHALSEVALDVEAMGLS